MNHYFKKYIKPEHQHQIPIIKYKTNFVNCIKQAFENRSYKPVENDDWDIIWSQKQFIPELYEKKLANHQKINHFKNYYELCRKDLLIKNLKKHKKTLQRQGKASQANLYNFYPQTYILPIQYGIFIDQFKKLQLLNQKNVWIMKPTGKSQGKGIFLFNKLSQVSHWENNTSDPYIVQRYLSDPLLIGGKKFDMRLYALVTSYSPLTVYFYRGGFARFTHCRYDQTKIQNTQIHLTNVAIQKFAEGYDETIGGKWYIQYLKHYMLSKYGHINTNQCFLKIEDIIVKTLQALQKVMCSDKNNSFQLYGFDILLDSKLNPWLIQVNGSPSMTANTETDLHFKLALLDDTLSVIDMQKFLLGNQQQIGGFDLIYKGKNYKIKDKANKNIPKISFLGTLNNRQQNLKKIAKTYAVRLNDYFDEKAQIQKKNIMKHIKSNNQNPTTKLNLNSKRLPFPKKTQISNNQVKNLISFNNELNTKQSNKQFIIKKRVKQVNNQNFI